jgi:methionyl-tRNA formyltransferase
LRVAFAGTPDFALPALAALAAHHQLVGVLTQPDRPSGRGRKLASSAVKIAADALGLPVAQPPTLKDDAAQAQLAAWQPDVLVVVAYGLILPRQMLGLPRYGCLNIHASLLPRWRGAAPIQRAILEGDAETGISIMTMDAGLDTGPVLLQRRLAISSTDTGGSLHDALAALGASALIEALQGVAGGTLPGTPQPAAGITYATKIEKAEARIDWQRPAIHIERQVRAFNPWPIAETLLDGEQLRILAAHALENAGNMPLSAPKSGNEGSIVDVYRDYMVVQCGQGGLAVTQVQRPGRRPVSVGDFSHALKLKGRRLG